MPVTLMAAELRRTTLLLEPVEQRDPDLVVRDHVALDRGLAGARQHDARAAAGADPVVLDRDVRGARGDDPRPEVTRDAVRVDPAAVRPTVTKIPWP